jgi:hypothetical protein
MRYALFQHSLDELDADAVGEALDEVVPWLARADARMLVRRAYGVLTEGLVEAHARALAQALGRRGVSVEPVEQDWLELPPLIACRRADVEPDALVVHDLYGRVTEVPWARVLLVAVGSYPVPERVPRARKPFEPKPRAASPWGLRGMLQDGSDAGQTSYEYVDRAQVMLDIVTDAPARYRIQRQRFDYSYLGERRENSAAANFPLLVRDLLEHTPGAIQNQGARQMRSEADDVMSYPGPNQFERESAWSLWRYLGPGARVDAGDPYRSSSATHMRLAAPLVRTGEAGATSGEAGKSSGGAAGKRPAGAAGKPAGAAGKRPSGASATQRPGQASRATGGVRTGQASESRALVKREQGALDRLLDEHGPMVAVTLAVLAGIMVAMAAWWVDPLGVLVALPVSRWVYRRVLRRHVRERYGTSAADDDGPG